MELNNISTTSEKSETKAEMNITTLEEAFARIVKIGKYNFRIKQNLKGKELFNLVNTFGFSEKLDTSVKPEDLMKSVFDNFGNHFDDAMGYIEYSLDGIKFYPVVLNCIYQVREVETNVYMMYQLLSFVYEAILLFTEISQRQLDDMK